jgi:hypothetical protein
VNKLVLFLIGVALLACTEISYKEPQPAGIKALTKIPSRFRGKYIQDKDTVEFFEKGLRGEEDGKEEVIYLSDSIVLKEYKHQYFISYRNGNVWSLGILLQKKNGDLFLATIEVPEDEAQQKAFMEKLSKETPIIQSNSHYIIEPSPRKLYSLIKKGYFKEREEPWMKKIN